MADNVTLNAMAGGSVVATDDAGAAGHVQLTKLAVSADGSATVIPADATNGLRVDLSHGSTVASTTVSVGTTAGGTQLVAASSTRRSLGIYNNGSATIFVGASGVTTAAGFPVPAGGALFIESSPSAAYFGIVATGTVDTRVIAESD